MIPVVSFVGYSNSGKTTLLIKVIKALKEMNIKVGTIKHHHGLIDLDTPGTDTWKHYQNGADVVVLATKDRIFLTKRSQEPTLDDVIKIIEDVDIILVEGYKKAAIPKIEILRDGIHSEIISPLDELIGLATDINEKNEILSIAVPKFPLNEPLTIANFLMEKFITKK